jgi:tetratricopeptide (TPR) repeat protein
MVKWIFIGIMGFILANFFIQKVEKPILIITKQDSSKNFNPIIYHLISLGNKRFISDIIWIYTLIESDIDHYKTADLNSWMYLRFNTIINLDPNFLEAYQFGGQYLSIIKDDDLGAKDIYDKGLAVYPNDYFLNFNAGFHYYFELDDTKNAIELFEKIKYHPNSPLYLASLIAKIKTGEGKLQEAYELMIEAYNKIPSNNHFFKKSFEDNLQAIKIELDLICLNQKHSKCNVAPPKGYNYILKNGVYTTDKPYKKFKISDKVRK